MRRMNHHARAESIVRIMLAERPICRGGDTLKLVRTGERYSLARNDGAVPWGCPASADLGEVIAWMRGQPKPGVAAR